MPLDGLPPMTLLGGLCMVCFGGWALAFYFIRKLMNGTAAAGKVLADKDKELDALKEANAEQRAMVSYVLRELGPTVTASFDTLRGLAERQEKS